MKDSDAREFLKDDLFTIGILLAIVISQDFVIALFHYWGLIDYVHPLKFGVFQSALTLFLGWRLLIAIDRWRYYK